MSLSFSGGSLLSCCLALERSSVSLVVGPHCFLMVRYETPFGIIVGGDGFEKGTPTV